jgi:hypothetical protein
MKDISAQPEKSKKILYFYLCKNEKKVRSKNGKLTYTQKRMEIRNGEKGNQKEEIKCAMERKEALEKTMTKRKKFRHKKNGKLSYTEKKDGNYEWKLERKGTEREENKCAYRKERKYWNDAQKEKVQVKER